MKKFKVLYTIFLMLICSAGSLFAPTVQILNETKPKKDIFIKFDQKINVTAKWPDKDGFYSITTSQIIVLPPGIKKLFWKYDATGEGYEYPLDWGFFDIGKIYISNDGQVLETGTRANTKALVFNVVQKGRQIVKDIKGAIVGTAQFFATPIKELLKENLPAIKDNPYKNKVAEQRLGSVIGPDEAAFRATRLPLVKAAQEKFMGVKFAPTEAPLEIAIAFSGGGIRALYSTLGALVALQMLSLLDVVMTITSLSGSTWAVFPWMQGRSLQDRTPMPVKEFLTSMLSRFEGQEVAALQTPFSGLLLTYDVTLGAKPANTIEHFKELSYIVDMLLVKFAFDQPVTLVDLYGALLANRLKRHFGDQRQRMHISDIAPAVRTGKFPLPVGTAKLESIDDWVEVNPFEVGSRYFTIGAYVPTWSFGRKFENGKSIDFAPEQSEGFFDGIFGAAFAANGREMYDNLIKDLNIASFIKDAFKRLVDTEVGKERVVWAETFNPFTAGDARFADAGVDLGCPTFACYRTGSPDIILVFDNSSVVGSTELYKQAQYAKNHKLNYPLKPEDFKAVGTNWEFTDAVRQKAVTEEVMNVYKAPNAPTVLYIKRITIDKNVDYTAFDPLNNYNIPAMKMTTTEVPARHNTFNLTNTKEETERLAKVAEFNVRSVAGKIKEEMLDSFQQRRKLKAGPR